MGFKNALCWKMANLLLATQQNAGKVSAFRNYRKIHSGKLSPSKLLLILRNSLLPTLARLCYAP